jgi:hypothetical protein
VTPRRALLEVGLAVATVVTVAVVNTSRADSHSLIVTAATVRAVAGAAVAPTLAELGCTDSRGALVTQEAVAAVDPHSTARGVVLSWRCVDGAGRRHPSVVQLVAPDPRGGRPELRQVLVRLSQDLRVHQVLARPDRISVLASYWSSHAGGCCLAGPAEGTVSSLRYVHAERATRGWVYEGAARVAEACGPLDVSVTVTRSQPRVGEAARINFVDVSPGPCALEGYPIVVAHTRDGSPRAAAQALSGLSGGVRLDTVAPMVVLQPRDAATAVLESLPSTYGGCDTSVVFDVWLPTGGQRHRLPFAMGLCEAQVHPITAGVSGWAD